MKYTIAFAIILSLSLATFSWAGDWDKQVHPGLYTVRPDQRDSSVIDMGLIVFFQGKAATIMGSEANATLEEAVKTLEERARDMGANGVVGVSFNPIVTGEPGIIVYGTAVKFVKK